MLEALTLPGFALHPEARCRAGLLCLESYRAVHGVTGEAAWGAAAAAELYIEAGFLFDNVADHETDEGDRFSASEQLALAIAMLNCGTAAASEAAGIAGADCVLLLQQLSQHAVGAAAGQFLDARLETMQRVTTDDALTMTSLKAGECGRLSASLGAGIAGAESEIIDLFGEFAFNLFTYFQLIDDVRDACPPEGPPGDFERDKKTVPLVFFRNSIKPDPAVTSDIIPLGLQDRNGEVPHLRFEQSGAPVFAGIVAEAYLIRAKSSLAELSERLSPNPPKG